jgi:hypothetical protein
MGNSADYTDYTDYADFGIRLQHAGESNASIAGVQFCFSLRLDLQPEPKSA